MCDDPGPSDCCSMFCKGIGSRVIDGRSASAMPREMPEPIELFT